jgi:phosphatidylglycerophosphate synthase
VIGAVVARQRDAGAMGEQLARLGLPTRQVLADGEPATALRAVADLLDGGDSDVLVVVGSLVLHDEALGDLVHDPRERTAALLASAGGPFTVRVQAGRVVDAGSAAHSPGTADRAFTGAVRLSSSDAPAAANAARAMAEVAADHGWTADPVDLLLVALVRTGVTVGELTLDPWPWQRDGDTAHAAALRDRLAGLDPARQRLARATKSDDDLWATLFARPVSRLITPTAIRRSMTPNRVTAASFLVALAAAVGFAGIRQGGLVGLVCGVTGALLLQLSFVLDCVDGDVARYRRMFSPRGAWLDASTDRLKEFAGYAGLAIGAGGTSTAWLLAVSALTLQTLRHVTDDTFTAVMSEREAPVAVVPLERPDGLAAPANASRAVQASRRSSSRPAVKWAKRLAHLPIGERWLIMSAGGALLRPQWALELLLGLGLLSLAYTCTGRSLRARGWPRRPASARERDVVRAQLDPGPLAAAVVHALRGGPVSRGASTGRFRWLLPPALRLVEYAVVVLLARWVTDDALAAAFAMLLCVAYHHYDALYAVLHRLPPAPVAVQYLGLGVEGRLLLVGGLAVAGADWLRPGLWVAAAAFAALFLGYGSLRVWRLATV